MKKNKPIYTLLIFTLSFALGVTGFPVTAFALRPQSSKTSSTNNAYTADPAKGNIQHVNRHLQAASFLRKKGAVYPEIIEILGAPHEHSDMGLYPAYLKEEIARQESRGILFRVARISNALATSFKGKETYLSDILFNAENPAPYGLLYMYICHESLKHSGINTKVEAVVREVNAWNTLPDDEQERVRQWADWYVNEIISRGIDMDANIIKDRFYEIAETFKSAKDPVLAVEHYVYANYGDMHLKTKHDMQRRLHYAAALTAFVLFFAPFLAGQASLLVAGPGFLLFSFVYYAVFRFNKLKHMRYFARDASVADSYKGVKDGSYDEGRVYFSNLLKVVHAYKANPFDGHYISRKKIIKIHFLSQIVPAKSFGQTTDRRLTPKGTLTRSPARSNIASSMLVEHFFASDQDVFSEPAWVALIEEASLNEKAWLDSVTSVMDLAVRIPFCAKNLVNLLYKAQTGQLQRYAIQDMRGFISTLSRLISILSDQNKTFRCRAILHLCDMHENKSDQETLFAMRLLSEMKFHIVAASNFNQVSADIVSRNIQDIIEQNGHVNMVLGAGSTITQPYHFLTTKLPSFAEQLASRAQNFKWDNDVRVWQLSEYDGLSREHEYSHARALEQVFFAKVFDDIEENVVFMGEKPNPEGFVESQKKAGGIDLIVSGVGDDGHIGYNFPGAKADPYLQGSLIKVRLTPETVEANKEAYPGIEDNPYAWTLGLTDIIQPHGNKKPKIVILVLGSKKAQALKKSLGQANSPLAKIMHELDVTVIVATEAIQSLIPDYLERSSATMLAFYGKEKDKYADLDTPAHMIDLQGRIVWVNKAWEGFTGFSENDVIGMPVWFLVGEKQHDSEVRVKSKLSERINNLPDIELLFRRKGQESMQVRLREWQVISKGQKTVEGIITTTKPIMPLENNLARDLKDKTSSAGSVYAVYNPALGRPRVTKANSQIIYLDHRAILSAA